MGRLPALPSCDREAGGAFRNLVLFDEMAIETLVTVRHLLYRKMRCHVARHDRRRNRATLGTAATISATEWQINPVWPWITTSGTDPCPMAITGVPQAIASIIVMPNGSGQSTGNR